MNKIKGTNFMTITVANGEIYEIDFTTSFKVDVMNYSEGEIQLSIDSAFSSDGTVNNYLSISSGTAYNSLTVRGQKLYIKAGASGSVSIVRVA